MGETRPTAGLVGRACGPWGLGVLVALVYLVVALGALGSYGSTWDFGAEYPYGERLVEFVRSGDTRYLELDDTTVTVVRRAPHPPFLAGHTEWFQVYPFAMALSAVSCLVLWDLTGLVPALQAHHLVVPLMVAGLLVALVRFGVPRIGVLASVAGALLLVASPRFFAHAANNLKDVPETCLYVVATLLGFVALTGGAVRWWVACGIFTGLALAQKANALFVPPTLALFLGLVMLTPSLRRARVVRWSTRGFLLGALAFLVAHYAVSPRYWVDPIDGPVARIAEILRLSQPGPASGAESRVSFHALWHVVLTTPPTLLLLAGVGLCTPRLGGPLRALLVAGLAVSIGRNLLPGARNFDGVRHFLEFYPYLSLAAGAGLATVVGWCRRAVPSAGAARVLPALVSAVFLLPPVVQTARTHPNGICYFNFLIGGCGGAQARGIQDATDYWGNSYWQAFAWLDEHAEPDARLIVPVGETIARCIAPERLRADLDFWRPQDSVDSGQPPVVYVTSITRRILYGDLMHALESRAEPVHRIVVQGGVVLEIYRLDRDAFGEEMRALWKSRLEARASGAAHRRWLAEHPEEAKTIWPILRAEPEVGREATLRRLREHLPEELHEGLDEVLDRLR